MVRRLRVLAVVLLLAGGGPLSPGPGSALRAQARRSLDPGHWAHELQEALHALGLRDAEVLLVRGGSGAAHLRLLRGIEADGGENGATALVRTWLARLEAEVGPWDPEAGLRRDGVAASGTGLLLFGEAGWTEDPSLPVQAPEAFGRLLVAGELGPGVSFWGDARPASGRGGKALHSAGVAVQAGSFDLAFGRVPVALGQGLDPFILNGRKPSGGAFLTSREPFRPPGALESLGTFRLHVGLSPFIRAPGTPSAWLGSYALSWSPHPRLLLGALRTTRFAGRGIEPFRLQDFFRMLVGQGKEDAFDDSQGELAARVRWRLLGQPVATYLSLAFEDKTTLWRDPGLLAGILVPRLRSEGLYTFRYEFRALGRRARWCSGCAGWDREPWYDNLAYGPYFLEGEPMGSLLGGNGAGHLGRVELWPAELPLRGWLEFRHLSRYDGNILLREDVRPGTVAERVRAWSLGAEGLLPRGWGFSGALHTALLDGEREYGASFALRFLTGPGT